MEIQVKSCAVSLAHTLAPGKNHQHAQTYHCQNHKHTQTYHGQESQAHTNIPQSKITNTHKLNMVKNHKHTHMYICTYHCLVSHLEAHDVVESYPHAVVWVGVASRRGGGEKIMAGSAGRMVGNDHQPVWEGQQRMRRESGTVTV